ncbi:MAG: GAF domain-containing protein [Anaerolineales bacterium]|nr:GAF domain-containing protein [Anaerolineales bacterium]
MADEHILIVLSKTETSQLLEHATLAPAGYRVTVSVDWKAAEAVLKDAPPDLIILGEKIEGQDSLDIIEKLNERFPLIPVILLPDKHSDQLAVEAFRRGFADYLQPPLRTNDVQMIVAHALERRRRWRDWVRLEARRDTKSLRQRVSGLEAIQRLGRKVTSLLDLDGVLASVVDAAVELTGAEEGSLLLLDDATGELYMRAGRNFQEDFVRTFRLPIRDTLAGQVLRTGKPLFIDEKTPQKIKTSYLVYTIIYVPLIVQERVIGVLEVDNRQSHNPFSEYHIALVSALAEYASIAIENARLYSRTEFERNKLETILTKIEEGVIVLDHDGRIVLMNRQARGAFNVGEKIIDGKRLRDVIAHQDLIDILREKQESPPSRVEITLEDGRVLNAQLTPIPEIGLVVTMQDITHLKELDRIKSDFVNTVSHDLRSPLTAILGYVELIDRVGPVNEQQNEFIRRVQISVHNITSLINDLLDLGRIEAGFDARKEIVPFAAVIQYAVDGLRGRSQEKAQEIILDVPEHLPQVLGNPVRLRQMISNLITNAIKYTPEGGKVLVNAHAEGEQIILQVTDNGPGIPPTDQPFIFDKFYRASNVPVDAPGTGLGLAIVKSIVENHQGRIWVESSLGKGTIFTVVLPITNGEL